MGNRLILIYFLVFVLNSFSFTWAYGQPKCYDKIIALLEKLEQEHDEKDHKSLNQKKATKQLFTTSSSAKLAVGTVSLLAFALLSKYALSSEEKSSEEKILLNTLSKVADDNIKVVDLNDHKLKDEDVLATVKDGQCLIFTDLDKNSPHEMMNRIRSSQSLKKSKVFIRLAAGKELEQLFSQVKGLEEDYLAAKVIILRSFTADSKSSTVRSEAYIPITALGDNLEVTRYQNAQLFGDPLRQYATDSNLIKFIWYAHTNGWQHFGPSDHYDWWLFPYDKEANGTQDRYQLTQPLTQELAQDEQYMKSYLQVIFLQCQAYCNERYNWDYGVRKFKLKESIKLFLDNMTPTNDYYQRLLQLQKMLLSTGVDEFAQQFRQLNN